MEKRREGPRPLCWRPVTVLRRRFEPPSNEELQERPQKLRFKFVRLVSISIIWVLRQCLDARTCLLRRWVAVRCAGQLWRSALPTRAPLGLRLGAQPAPPTPPWPVARPRQGDALAVCRAGAGSRAAAGPPARSGSVTRPGLGPEGSCNALAYAGAVAPAQRLLAGRQGDACDPCSAALRLRRLRRPAAACGGTSGLGQGPKLKVIIPAFSTSPSSRLAGRECRCSIYA